MGVFQDNESDKFVVHDWFKKLPRVDLSGAVEAVLIDGRLIALQNNSFTNDLVTKDYGAIPIAFTSGGKAPDSNTIYRCALAFSEEQLAKLREQNSEAIKREILQPGTGSTNDALAPTNATRPTPDAEVYVRLLKHARASEVENMMRAAVGGTTNTVMADIVIVADDHAGALTITTHPENMNFFDTLITVWDVEGRGYTNNLAKACLPTDSALSPTNATGGMPMTQIYVLALQYARATKILERIWTGREIDSIKQDTRIIADDRGNTLTVITRPENMPLLERLVTARDVEEGDLTNSPDKADSTTKAQYAR
jgi:type II secretory pathway component GspD/PulD (secretin)